MYVKGWDKRHQQIVPQLWRENYYSLFISQILQILQFLQFVYEGGNHSAAYKGCPSYKKEISKSLNRIQNISYAQAVCRRAAKEEIDAFEENAIINIQKLVTIIAKNI